MKLFKAAELLRLELQGRRQNGVSIGFVPTMGALHFGHLSLIQRAREENDAVVCCIFVNPKQFNEQADLVKYPRPLEKDVQMLEKEGVDYVFHPEVSEIYGSEYLDDDIDLNNLDHILEGQQRPGHFQGVAKVVKRLFEIVQPTRAYFGQKDFQQTVVVRLLIKKFFPETHLVVCPIIRESHGLAMSSRNERLSEQNRLHAAFIYKSLLKLKERLNYKPIQEALASTSKYLNSVENAELEYLAVVDGNTMKEVDSLDASNLIVVVVVVKYCDVRLLDNIIIRDES